ncbi:MAG: DUF1254 domain-containing protein [Rhizobiaceae bacterium]|nr:DUF1254 domain-containing protein [Rhizobiaceae bacterium]
MDRAAYSRIGYALLMGLLGAAILHIVILLLLPEISSRNAWSRMADAADLYQPMQVRNGLPDVVHDGNRDPLFKSIVCRFDLTDGLLRMQASGAVPFWSASIYDRAGNVIHSFNDRSAHDRALDIVVLTPAQMLDVRKEVPEELGQSVFVETQSEEGIALVRAFVQDESWGPAVEEFLASLRCQPQ